MYADDPRSQIEIAGKACEYALQREAEMAASGEFELAAGYADVAELLSMDAFAAARSIPTGDHWS